MNLSTIIEKKKEEFEKEFPVLAIPSDRLIYCTDKAESFLEKAIRESVEEALLEVRLEEYNHFDVVTGFDKKVKEFMK